MSYLKMKDPRYAVERTWPVLSTHSNSFDVTCIQYLSSMDPGPYTTPSHLLLIRKMMHIASNDNEWVRLVLTYVVMNGTE